LRCLTSPQVWTYPSSSNNQELINHRYECTSRFWVLAQPVAKEHQNPTNFSFYTQLFRSPTRLQFGPTYVLDLTIGVTGHSSWMIYSTTRATWRSRRKSAPTESHTFKQETSTIRLLCIYRYAPKVDRHVRCCGPAMYNLYFVPPTSHEPTMLSGTSPEMTYIV
jgi:hypothetical protein